MKNIYSGYRILILRIGLHDKKTTQAIFVKKYQKWI